MLIHFINTTSICGPVNHGMQLMEINNGRKEYDFLVIHFSLEHRYVKHFNRKIIAQMCSNLVKPCTSNKLVGHLVLHLFVMAHSFTLEKLFIVYELFKIFFKLHFVIIVMQELHDIPLFFSLHNICANVKCTSPSAVLFRSAVLNAGYRISSTHVNPLGLKTDAPWDVIWDIMRCWVHPFIPFAITFLTYCVC